MVHRAVPRELSAGARHHFPGENLLWIVVPTILLQKSNTSFFHLPKVT